MAEHTTSKLPDGSQVKPDAHNSLLALQQRITEMREADILAEMAEVLPLEELRRIKNLPVRRVGIGHSTSLETDAEEGHVDADVKNRVPVYVSGAPNVSAVLDAYIRALVRSGDVVITPLVNEDASNL